MFSNLKQGAQLHILHKSANPYVEIGTIESTTNVPIMGYYPNMPSIPIDITVRVGDKVTTYQQLPAGAESAEVIERSTGEQVFVACAKDAINSELNTMRQKSVETINSVEYHKQRIKSIDTLIGQLNPEILEKQQQAQEICDLRAQLADMRKLVEEMRASSSTKEE